MSLLPAWSEVDNRVYFKDLLTLSIAVLSNSLIFAHDIFSFCCLYLYILEPVRSVLMVLMFSKVYSVDFMNSDWLFEETGKKWAIFNFAEKRPKPDPTCLKDHKKFTIKDRRLWFFSLNLEYSWDAKTVGITTLTSKTNFWEKKNWVDIKEKNTHFCWQKCLLSPIISLLQYVHT